VAIHLLLAKVGPVSLILLLGLALSVLAWLLGEPHWRRWRRQRVAARPFPAAWRAVLHRRLPVYRRLPPPLQTQLKRLIQVFIAEKPFIGCQGQVITDEVRVTIAAQACLLLLNRDPALFDRLRQVLVYPGAFVVERLYPGPDGVLQDQRHALSGESWQQGQVILSWEDVLAGAADPDDGRNVVLHEFAHQLDQANGSENGAPSLGSRRRHAAWAAVFEAEYQRLQQRLAWGEPTLLNAYGATSPAEFFAVATEAFFEQAQALAVDSPALYAQLAGYYQVDPRAWR